MLRRCCVTVPPPRLANFAGAPTLPVKGRVKKNRDTFASEHCVAFPPDAKQQMLREGLCAASPLLLTLPLTRRVAAEGGGVG